MRNDNQLTGRAEFLEQRNKATQVNVVKRGFNLVEYVKGTRARAENSDEHCQRRQRLLAAGEQRQPLNLFARRAGFNLDTCREQVVRLGENQSSVAAREKRLKDCGEFCLDIVPRVCEELQDRGIDFLDNIGEVLAGLEDIIELRG